NAEVAERVMIHRLQARQPLKTGFVSALAFDLASRRDSPRIGVNPHTDEQPGWPWFASRTAFHRLHAGFKAAQVEPADEIPDSSNRMRLVDPPLQIHRSQERLVALDGAIAGTERRWRI